MRKRWFFWSEEEIKRYNTKRQQIIHRELYVGFADRTKKENQEKLKRFLKEYGQIL